MTFMKKEIGDICLSLDMDHVAPSRVASLRDLPNEMLDEIFSHIQDVRDAICLKDSTRETRSWWESNRARVANKLCQKTIPVNLWSLAALTQVYAAQLIAQEMVVPELTVDAGEVLGPLVARRHKASSIELSDPDLVAMTARHLDFGVQVWSQEKGHAQLHAAAKALVPGSSGDLDSQDVLDYLLPLRYSMFIARRMTPATARNPNCRYGRRPDWYTELALGAMMDLKPSGWWDGLNHQADEETVRESLQTFFGAQSGTADPEGKYDYL